MKILQINNCHYRRGGADSVYLNTIELLKKFGNEVFEFSQSGADNFDSEFEDYFVNEFNPLKLNTLTKITSTPRQLYSIEASYKLAKLLQNLRPDIAHIHLYKGVLTASILTILKKNKIPICITLHDYSLLCPRNILFDGDNKICEKCISSSSINCVIKRCNRKNLMFSFINYLEFNINNNIIKPENYFDKIIPVSRFSFNKHSLKKSIKDKLVHLYNFSPKCESAIPNPEKGNYFLYFGRLSNEKGLHTLINAFQKLGSAYKLKIVGTGPLVEELKSIIKIKNIDFLGFKTGNELNAIVADCSFVIVPSEWYENNPMTIVEGYSLGKPVIGSRIGGIPELIEDNLTGYTFEMANIDDLVDKITLAEKLSPSDYATMSHNAREFALTNFTENLHYNKLIEIYKSILIK